MATKPVKKIEKKEFNITDLKASLGLGNQTVKEKELSWIPFNKAFHDALGIPGVPRGYTTQFRGFSDTGKSTGIYEAIVGAQKLGDLVVIFDTEGNFNWKHARSIGFEYEDVWGDETIVDHVGDFIYYGGTDLLDAFSKFDYDKAVEGTKPLRFIPVIEDIARAMNLLLDKQASGDLDRNITFGWDSIGSISCYKSAVSNSNNNMWNAGALNRSFESILNYRIPASRRESSKFINTFVTVQKIWLQPNQVGQPTIMHKGGDGFKYGVRLIVHLGGKTTSGAKKLSAVNGGRNFQFGVETKIECFKNHVNGIELKGLICSTPHGFISPEELDQYKKDKKDFINEQLGTNFDDFTIVKEDIELSESDMKG